MIARIHCFNWLWIAWSAASFGNDLGGQDQAVSDRRHPVVSTIELTPDGNSLVVGSQAGITMRTVNGNTTTSIETELENVNAIAFSPDGKVVALGGGTPGVSGGIELRNWPNNTMIRNLAGHRDVVTDLAWTDNSNLASSSADNSIRVWNVSDGTCSNTIEGHSGPVLALALSPDGSLLCSGSVDNTIRVWSTGQWKLARILNNHLGIVNDLRFCLANNPEQSMMLASASDDATVRIWHPKTGRMVRIIRHPAPVFCIRFSADGSNLYSGSKDGAIRLLAGESQ